MLLCGVIKAKLKAQKSVTANMVAAVIGDIDARILPC